MYIIIDMMVFLYSYCVPDEHEEASECKCCKFKFSKPPFKSANLRPNVNVYVCVCLCVHVCVSVYAFVACLYL